MPTLDQISKVDKEVETKKAIEEKNKVESEWKNLIKIEDAEESYFSSLMSMYSIILIKKAQKCHPTNLPLWSKFKFLKNKKKFIDLQPQRRIHLKGIQ